MANKTVRKTASRKTLPPTGLTIVRNGSAFNISWKIGDADYKDGQYFNWRRVLAKRSLPWIGRTVGVASTASAFTIDPNLYYPKSSVILKEIDVRVRGKRTAFQTSATTTKKVGKKSETTTTITTFNNSLSDFAIARYLLFVPPAPTVSNALDENLTNVSTFSWSVAQGGEHQWFTDVEWQSMLVRNSNETNGSKIPWSVNGEGFISGTGGSSGSRVITEDSTALANASCTRWFRIRSRGPAGAGVWVYSRHVYAIPYQANVSSSALVANESGGYNCMVTWEAPSNASHPIDKVVVQYAYMVPASGLQPVNGASWTDAITIRDTAGNDRVNFSIDDTLDEDQCMFVRVNTIREYNTTYGIGKFVAAAKLKNPSGLSVTTSDATHRATIEVTNNSENPDSCLAVVYKTADEEIIVGVIPHGEETITVQCPDWTGKTVAFGVYSFVGDYSYQEIGDVKSYTIAEQIRSKDIVWEGGAIPLAPSRVIATPSLIPETITVMWDWAWEEADRAELSWADHEDAWESTDEPSTYTINNLNIAKWNISGLETGVKWYIRVRLISGTGESATYSPWSEITEDSTVNLASAPSIPVLVLSSAVIRQDEPVVCSWAYSTTDGTAQAYAEICECSVTTGGITHGSYKPTTDVIADVDRDYYSRTGSGTEEDPYVYELVENIVYPDPEHGVRGDNPQAEGWYVFNVAIARAQAEQHITINPADVGWEVGHTYSLAVRVTSASGAVSDDWSVPVTITVAEPLEVSIDNTSLSDKVKVSGNVVVFETSQIENVEEATAFITAIQDGDGEPSLDNIRPIHGLTELTMHVADEEEGTGTDYSETFSRTVYGGTIDFVSGTLTVTHGYIDSYDGEEINSPWIADRCLDNGADAPIEGSQVVYELETAETYNLTANTISTLEGINYIWADVDQISIVYSDSTIEQKMLGELPLTIEVGSAGENAEISVAIERAEAYMLKRPDETKFNGFEGETIAIKTRNGDGVVEFSVDEVRLDDGASYRIVVTAKDEYGQSAMATQLFNVHWMHQAVMPDGTAEPDNDRLATIITPIAPTGARQGDVCDIYRLSADRPELIVEDAIFDEAYVDPYPAIGQMGGHRIVYRTENGDYITGDNRIAWKDITVDEGNVIDTEFTVIDFDEGRVMLNYNVDLSHSWSKDFTATEYLGGSVQGDWNPAVGRETSISAEVITIFNPETVEALRRLAVHSGICHVRTTDGSSFAADVQVSEKTNHDKYGTRSSFDLKITRVDQEQLDGMTIDEWNQRVQ